MRINWIQLQKITSKMEPILLNIAENKDFQALFTPQLQKLRGFFESRGFEIRIAGGAVRDLLMNIKPADVDFASTATPTQMKEIFEAEQIRMLHKRGEEHGTITCRIDDCENFEVTTLRVDVVCDGRRAKVEFTEDWQLDANRRDLTINSLFLSLDGTVVDYFGGIGDIKSRRVCFVGDARQRIQEDYLRILRYFRFFGRISNTSEHEDDTILAIIENKDGIKGISGERIWTELKKIVIGRMASEVIYTMIKECKLNVLLGLPEECNIERFKMVFKRFEGSLDPMTMIACLCEEVEDISNFHKVTKLSNDERNTGEFILEHRREAQENLENIDFWQDKIVDLEQRPGHDPSLEKLRRRVVQLAKSVGANREILEIIEKFESPKFPIDGKVLMSSGNLKKGPHVRNVLMYLFDLWRQSKFSMSQEELLEHTNDGNIPILSKKSTSPKRV
ncbi:unnamed protein product [Caenorhabditis angaria]|uniref:Poly A polymerase head domain-containing protein n=1 Tax=Caenorhabditis angaria TaxID=860376 RepID=A0A9P1N4D2_9PELO|nr:unnamed protein product [Caenorhabditis angaria]